MITKERNFLQNPAYTAILSHLGNNKKVLKEISQLLNKKEFELDKWYQEKLSLGNKCFYTSVDIRYCGNKLVPIDTNLFPAGFNNLNDDNIDKSAKLTAEYITSITPNCKNILVIGEDHTRNLHYLDNLKTIENIIIQAGYNCKIGSLNSTEEMKLNGVSYKDINITPLVKEDNLLSWFIKHKIYNIRPGLFPENIRTYKETINLKSFPIYNFFKNNDITFYNEEALSIYEKYKNSKENLILLDPPYINSCNDFYINKNINIYEYLCNNNIKKEKARIILILENIWIIRLLFKNNMIIHEYEKKYEMNRRKTTHIIIGQK